MSLEARKKRIFDIISVGNRDDWPSRAFDIALIAMILANLFIAVFSTFQSSAPYHDLMGKVELVTVIAFTIEYALRVWTAEYLYPALPPWQATVRYMVSFNGVVDLLSFLLYYLPFFFPTGVVAFRLFRVVRIFRLFRVNAYYDALNVIADVLRSKKNQLLSSIFIILVLMTASSLCMYSLEHEAQPEVFQNAFSGLWWSVSTLLTVGYGDIYPVTTAGRIFGTILTFLGVGMVAIPTGILSAGFVEQYARLKNFNDYAQADIRFVRLDVGPGHPWAGKAVRDLPLPPGLILAVIQRGSEAVVPRGETVLAEGDKVVLGAEGYQDETGVTLREITLRPTHPWAGRPIRDLDISRQTLIVMVRRGEKVLVPNGDLVLEPEDEVLLYSRKNIRDAQSTRF